jgi:hypothetical protein
VFRPSCADEAELDLLIQYVEYNPVGNGRQRIRAPGIYGREPSRNVETPLAEFGFPSSRWFIVSRLRRVEMLKAG